MNEHWLRAWLLKRLEDVRSDLLGGGAMLLDALGDEGNRGELSSVAAEAVEDSEKVWIPGLWESCDLMMLTGAGAGLRFDISDSTANGLSLPGEDLVGEGILEGDRYQIVTPEMDRARSWLGKTDIGVILGYPRDEKQLPCLTLTRTASREVKRYIGRQPARGSETGGLRRVRSSDWEMTFQIGVWTDNPDTSYWLHRLIEWLYIHDVKELSLMCVEGLTASGGDIEPQPDLFPSFVFLRALTLNAVVRRDVDQVLSVGKITQIQSSATTSYVNPGGGDD